MPCNTHPHISPAKFYGDLFEVVREPALDGFGVEAAAPIKTRQMIGPLWGPLLQLSKHDAENEPVPQEHFRAGYRARLLRLNSDQFRRARMFPEYAKLQPLADSNLYLVMHEWCAMGRVNSCRGAGLYVECLTRDLEDGSREYRLHRISKDPLSSESSSNSAFFRLDANPNVEFVQTPTFNDEFYRELAKTGRKIPPLVMFVVVAKRCVSAGEKLYADYEYDNEPDRALVHHFSGAAKALDDQEVLKSFPPLVLLPPSASTPASHASELSVEEEIEEIDLSQLDQEYIEPAEKSKKGEKRKKEKSDAEEELEEKEEKRTTRRMRTRRKSD